MFLPAQAGLAGFLPVTGTEFARQRGFGGLFLNTSLISGCNLFACHNL